jgi:ferredoxin
MPTIPGCWRCRPFTRLTWDNAALLAPATARRLGVKTHDVVDIAVKRARLRAPVYVLPGQARDCITLRLGWGRSAGGLSVGAGFDAYRLRDAADPWIAELTSLTKTGEVYRLATTQEQNRVLGRDLIREGTLEQFNNDPASLQRQESGDSLYPSYKYPDRAWVMAIDLNSCIGCQACTIACQAENNVPVVGKDQVLDGEWCIGCASIATIPVPPMRLILPSNQCPACIARTRRAKWSVPCTPRFMIMKAST